MKHKPIENTHKKNSLKMALDNGNCKQRVKLGQSDGKKELSRKAKMGRSGCVPTRRDIAYDQAQKRLMEAVSKAENTEELYLVDDHNPGAWEKAVYAEMKSRGAGIASLLND